MSEPPTKPQQPPPPPEEKVEWDLLDDPAPADDGLDDSPWPAADDEPSDWEAEPHDGSEAPIGDWDAQEGDDPNDDGLVDEDPETQDAEQDDWTQEAESGQAEGWQGEEDGPVTVGWSERASLPTWGIHRVPARCSTDQETSALFVELRAGLPGRVTLVLGDQTVDVGVGGRGDDLVALTSLRLRGLEFEATLRICATTGPPRLVLGRDVLGGRYLVDPGLSWTQRSNE